VSYAWWVSHGLSGVSPMVCVPSFVVREKPSGMRSYSVPISLRMVG